MMQTLCLIFLGKGVICFLDSLWRVAFSTLAFRALLVGGTGLYICNITPVESSESEGASGGRFDKVHKTTSVDAD